HQALALVDATAIVTTKTPIRLIQNNFVSPNPEVGLEVFCVPQKAPQDEALLLKQALSDPRGIPLVLPPHAR
ncbi:MAG TPA: hypothetical protein VN814_18810, partial [Caulobacteraceae bacterium]|nr:hypothetical protein [Caulobacteraceae bacterium]